MKKKGKIMSLKKILGKSVKIIQDSVGIDVLKPIINIYLKKEELGKMLKFEIDSEEKSIDCSLLLNGETEPVYIQINDYQIIESDSVTQIKIRDVSIDRKWMEVLAKKHLVSKTFEIPDKVKDYLGIFK